MSKKKQAGAKRASKPLVAYAFIRSGIVRPSRKAIDQWMMLFHKRKDALRLRRKGGTDFPADGPIHKLTSMPSKRQVALTRAIARRTQIQTMLNELSYMPATTKAVLAFKKDLRELLRVRSKEVAFDEGLDEKGELLK